ncbi:MAG: hypothetical protein P4L40_18075 [Terracidiphilus sp.]|nr:hypothetical protein [Terracidiphilus sp.]
MTDSSFTLTKWYLDCVTADGDAAILYSGVLDWRGLSLSYNSLLTVTAGRVESRTSMARAQVRADAEQIRVCMPKLGIEGHWRRSGHSFRTKVYEGEHGSVDWNCVQTGSAVYLNVEAQTFNGTGYAECLKLTVPPWLLPMKQLRWGRFVCAEHTLAWIDWQGTYNNSFAVLDGRQVALTSVNEEEVCVGGARLRMSESLPLRTGKLGDTVLPAAPRLRRMLPRALAAIEEHKWRSRGVLTCGDQRSEGWVIHEVVHWSH